MSVRMTLGVDLGGSSSKATLLDENGKVVATATKEYPSYSLFPGWLEQDADELFDAVIHNIREIIHQSGVDSRHIAALSIDAATHMAVLCDENSRPLRRFIHWSDSRCGKQAAWLRNKFGRLLKDYSVNSVSAAWTLPQLLWIRENEPELLEKVRRIYFLKDYIRSRFTGDFCTDYIEAMGAMMSDDRTARWIPELCAIVGLDVSVLPEVKCPTDIAGYIDRASATLTGLTEGTPVLVGTTDTVMEVYASGAIREGCATVKLATAGRICPITDHAIPSHQFFNYKHIIPGKWYPGTGTRSCAASYKWYRDVFGEAETKEAEKLGVSAYDILNLAAEEVPAGSEGLYFHPYLLGEMTPYYNDKLRASFTGIGMHHSKGHFSRAVMEGISYSMRDCLEEIKAQKIDVQEYRIIGGGAKGKLWRQILSDVLNTELTITKENDSSLGSAMMAGVAAGIFADFEDSVRKCTSVADVVRPIPQNVDLYNRGFEYYRRIQQAMAAVYDSMF